MPVTAQASVKACPACSTRLPADAAFCPECGLAVGPTPGWPVLPGMRILRVIGHGGDADVYLAQQESLDRTVAVKVLRHDIDDQTSWRAFLQEARAVAKLSGHPHVVTVYDAGRAGASGHPYLVTEYLDRGSLHDVIADEGALPPMRVAEIGAAIADALQAAHSLGIHHRDLKPGNVLLGSDGRVKLADFGIARLLSGRSITTTDLYAFTPEHVAPEVLRHEPDGPWSDLYGLASTLATALLGAAPVRQHEGERVDAYLTRKMMAPAPRLPSSVPRSIAEPIERALDPSPDRRPTVPEFARAMATSAALQRQAQANPSGTVQALTPHESPPPRAAVVPPWLGRRERHEPEVTERSGLRRWLLVLALCFGIWAIAVVAVVLLTRDDPGDGDSQSAATTAATGQVSSTAPTATLVAPAPVATIPPATSATAQAPVATTPPATSAVAPTTAAAVTTSPPPATTVPPIVEPATVAPTTVAPRAAPESAVVSASAAEGFMRTYYDEVAAGDYESSWASLTPEFQSGKAQSYDYYVNFWDENDIAIGDVRLVASDATGATVDVDLRWNGSGPWQTDEFELERASSGELLIAAQRSIG